MATLKYLDLSTSHIKEEHVNLVLETKGLIFSDEDGYIGLHGYPYEEGTFISIGEIDEYGMEYLFEEGFEELAKILIYCREHGITLLRFDRDADECLWFDTFKW